MTPWERAAVLLYVCGGLLATYAAAGMIIWLALHGQSVL